MGQFVDALKTSIINGLAYTGLCNANCEGDDTELLDNVHSLLKESSASQPNPSTSHGRKTIHDGLSGSRTAEQVQQEVNDVDMDLFSVASLQDVLRAVRCDDLKTINSRQWDDANDHSRPAGQNTKYFGSSCIYNETEPCNKFYWMPVSRNSIYYQ